MSVKLDYSGSINVGSDIKHLKCVVVHQPDQGIEWVTPSNADDLLYDDIVFLPQMIDQHQRFVEVLTALLGSEAVVEFQDLLEDILGDHTVHDELLDIVVTFEKLSGKQSEYLRKLSVALTGYCLNFRGGTRDFKADSSTLTKPHIHQRHRCGYKQQLFHMYRWQECQKKGIYSGLVCCPLSPFIHRWRAK